MSMTAEQFKLHTGYEPVDDDLARVNCPHAGQIGHQHCGWCMKCDAPRFQCSHLLPVSSNDGAPK